MTNPATTTRQVLRRHYRLARQQLSQIEQDESAANLRQQIIKHDIFDTNKQGKKVAIYKTNDGELNTQPLIEYMWSQGIEVYLPVLHPFSRGHLLFLRYTSLTPMQTNQFGILEPCLDIRQIALVSTLDVLFTPLVAFDNNGNRLGMGGGFYDRTLSSIIDPQFLKDCFKKAQVLKHQSIAEQSLSQHNTRACKQTCKVIGLAHDLQKTTQLPREAWDIPLPYVLTPTQYYDFT